MSSRPRRYTSSGGFGSSHFPDDRSDDGSQDLDIDFSITESGRTVAHVIAGLKGEKDDMAAQLGLSGRSLEALDKADMNMDISISNSGRSIGEDVPVTRARTRSASKEIASSIPLTVSTIGEKQSSSYDASESAFVSGLMNPGKGGVVSHTPPTGSSYETRHFGKRPRTGVTSQGGDKQNGIRSRSNSIQSEYADTKSVSGRLRSASDLEDKGIIDRIQKGVLKDLIISGDEALQEALDKYEKGDRSQLEAMIKDGLLAKKLPVDMDLLGDLDLDFLTVDDGTVGSIGRQNLEQPGKNVPPIVSGFPSGNSVGGDSNFTDGIGDLEFPLGGDSDAFSFRNSRSNSIDLDSYRLRSGSIASLGIGARSRSNSLALDLRDRSNSLAHPAIDARDRSNSLAHPEIDARDRSNSLAFGSLRPTSAEVAHQRWMDRPIPGKDVTISRKGPKNPVPVSGIGASLAEYNGRSEPKLSKAQQAEEKRRERQRKKEDKEREKQAEKERKEQERREKREQKELEKQQRKTKKVLKPKPPKEEEVEEVKVTQSGTGRPRSMSDPNLKSSVDENGLMQVERPDGWVGAYSPESRKLRIERFMEKRNHRVWTKSVKYDVRKNFADSRLRVKGRFVKKEDELLMRELMSLT